VDSREYCKEEEGTDVTIVMGGHGIGRKDSLIRGLSLKNSGL
jgi:hypothetical protein